MNNTTNFVPKEIINKMPALHAQRDKVKQVKDYIAYAKVVSNYNAWYLLETDGKGVFFAYRKSLNGEDSECYMGDFQFANNAKRYGENGATLDTEFKEGSLGKYLL